MLKRIEAIREIIKNVNDEVIISSTGMISRELYAVRDTERNFYMQGSMGSALAIGLGIALNSKHNVIVLSGDAAALMSMGTFALHKKLNPKNLKHYILDNNVHASTGGQPTSSDAVDFETLAPQTKVIRVTKEKGNSPRIPIPPKEIMTRFREAIKNKR